jgi:glycosyltransferase involved in cell wall biosynthesis
VRIAINALFWGQPATGSGQYVRHLVRHLAEVAPELELMLVAPQHVSLDDALGHAWAVPMEAPLDSNLGKLLGEQWLMPLVAQRHEADLIHVPYFAPPWRSPLPVVVTIHDLIPLLLPDYRGGLLVRAYTAWAARAARHAQRILTDSRASARDIIERLRVPPERVQVIYLAAEESFCPVPREADGELRALRQRLGLPQAYLLYLGGFDRRKHVTELLQAYQRANLAREGLPLVIGGRLPDADTPFAPDPRRIAAELGLGDAVQFLGWVDEADKPALYRGARAFCFPSAYEGFGLPPLEAIACGTPAIVGSGSSLEEVTGSGGLAVPPDDVDALADALRRMAGDDALRARLSAGGLAHAARFSWEATARQTAAAYREVAGG